MTIIANAKSQAHCLVAQPDALPKPVNKLVSPSHIDMQTDEK